MAGEGQTNPVSGALLARGSFFVLAAEASRLLLKLIQTPIVLAVLGLEGYGIWALLFSLCAYIDQFNTSFGFAYAKFTAELDTRGERESLRGVISAGLLVVLSGAAVVAGAMLFWHEPLLRTLGVRPALLADASAALALVVGSLFVRMSVGCYWRMLAGLQRVDLQKKLEVVANVLEFLVAVSLLLALRSLSALALAVLVHESTLAFGAWIVWRRLRGPLRVAPWRATREGLRRILSLGGRFQLLSVLGLVVAQGIRFFLSAVLGPAALGLYELADKVVQLARVPPMAVIQPLLPAFAALEARGARTEAHALYLRASRILALVTLAVFGFVCVAAELLLRGWTGGMYDPAPTLLRILAGAAVIHLLTGVGTAALRGREILSYEFRYYGLQLLGMTLLIYPLYRLLGLQGAVVGYSVAFGGGALWFLWAYGRAEGIPFRVYWREVLLPPGLRVLAAAALLTLLGGALPLLFAVDLPRLLVVLNVGILAVLYGGLVFGFVWKTGLLDRTEEALVRRFAAPWRRRLPGRRREISAAGVYQSSPPSAGDRCQVRKGRNFSAPKG